MSSEIPVPRDLNLIETLRHSRACGFARLDLHLARLADSSRALGHVHDRDATLRALDDVVAKTPGEHLRVRLEQAPHGGIAVTAQPFSPLAADVVWEARLADYRLDPEDGLLMHKTTRRGFYDEARAVCGADEAIFLNTRGEICEGAITSIFVERDGRLLTPPLDCGLLAGVLRRELLDSGRALERVLYPGDLAEGFYLGNSLRGLIRTRMK